MLRAGVDVGGTRIKSVLCDADGSVLLSRTDITPSRPGEGIVDVVADVVAALTADAASSGHDGTVGAVGVVVPGIVDEAKGLASFSANLGWRDLPLRDRLSERLGVPATLGHDVRAGLLAEHRLGAAQGVADVLFVPLGTGIASALLVHGTVVRGNDWTGEIGHVTVDPGGPRCGCGRLGCLEAVASAGAIGRAWRDAGHDGDAVDLVRTLDDPAADSGSRSDARQIWATAIDALVRVLASACAAAGTRLVLVGGGLVLAGDVLLTPLREGLTAALGHDQTTTAPAALGDRAAALGASLLAMEAAP
ncbi:glucokinase [Knoellia remsis]|uniref:Glucokinase n=1 Tax=Knoellia remsis TaxID=407159 RepID=A0A2T0TYR5_9MICO|nr:ROK family protein [Knoellia remsis]PRY50780.1 glucokinase [Knoellia remsis]